MIINRMDRKRVSLTVTVTEATGGAVVVPAVDLAVLRPHRKPSDSTLWESILLTGNKVSFFLSGPDAEEPGEVVIPVGGGDIWIRVVEGDEIDHKFVERIELR